MTFISTRLPIKLPIETEIMARLAFPLRTEYITKPAGSLEESLIGSDCHAEMLYVELAAVDSQIFARKRGFLI
jgi:hypothetical protein